MDVAAPSYGANAGIWAAQGAAATIPDVDAASYAADGGARSYSTITKFTR